MRRRFFVEGFDGHRVTMAGEAAHHLGRVLRAQPGQLYELSDGQSVWLARIDQAAGDRIDFTLVEQLPSHELHVRITLLLSIVKFDAFEWAIEKATELGVSRIVPLAAARSEKALVAASPKRSQRWSKILLEAAQQSRRVKVPDLAQLAQPEAAFRSLGGDLRLLLSERTDAPHLRAVLEGRQAGEVTVAIGPEGGWTDREVGSAERFGFSKVSLGSLILRTETAVAAALASVNYALASSRRGTTAK